MRNPSIDILRSIGLLMVILAHVQPSEFVYQLRTFDVVLMVFVSGLTFSRKPYFNYWQYLKKRTSRLIIPTYIFLTAYFLLSWAIKGSHESLTTIVLSYTLIGGIGYVWIIRIFLLIMIVAPVLYRITTRLSLSSLIAVLLLFLAVSDVLAALSTYTPIAVQRLLEIVVIPVLGYSVPYSVALRLKQTSKSKELTIILIFSFLFAAVCYYLQGESLLINNYKTPPRTIYLCYGMLVSILLYKMIVKTAISNSRILKTGGVFLGQNTIWIYFWHIPFVNEFHTLSYNWILYYITVLAASVTIYTIQYTLVKRTNNGFINRYFVG